MWPDVVGMGGGKIDSQINGSRSCQGLEVAAPCRGMRKNRWVKLVVMWVGWMGLGSMSLYAHVGGHGQSGFHSGLMHPVHGLDHLLAMVAVGILAVFWSGWRRWVLPLTFMSSMVVGALLVPLVTGVVWVEGLVEPTIVLSVFILGALLVWGQQLPLVPLGCAVGVMALAHGFAHAAEMAESVGWLEYVAGFVLGTGCLHLLGLVLGLIAERWQAPAISRVAGVMVCAGGLLILIGVWG